jgi:hypothetical protein
LRRRFNPISLDALNFLLADVRGNLDAGERLMRVPASTE